MRPKIIRNLLIFLGIMALSTSCLRTQSGIFSFSNASPTAPSPTETLAPLAALLPPTRVPGSPILTPTPDTPHDIPSLRLQAAEYTVQSGDTFGNIANKYGISMDTLATANPDVNPDVIGAGQVLEIPAPTPGATGPDFKIIPDSELVYGPASATFDISAFVKSYKGYLNTYTEQVNNQQLDGAGVVAEVAREYSVNPRLLLAVLEFQSHWVTQANPDSATLNYPLRFDDQNHVGLFNQLSWAANNLNRGYYQWKANTVSHYVLPDGSIVPVATTINAGTAGVQYLMSLLYNRPDWDSAVSQTGLFVTYSSFFGYPFDLAIEPLIPSDLKQPAMQLPFVSGDVWSFTGGPHAGWGDGSVWASLDFAPPGDSYGCVESDAWVTAVANGLVTRSDNGIVILDLDKDGIEQTGWTVLYLHIEDRDRVAIGSMLKAGDHIGHPSCEGGEATGTHVHIARRYNGEWIPADGAVPFTMDGWVAQGNGTEYDGLLVREGQIVEAWDNRNSENQISR
jgi:murein DD-endopeptidase MepM/ murein hydrolase activator NlpD